jgi:hypothetical protein
MEDVTVIIQGRLMQDSYDFYIKNYRECPVIISTWIDNKIDFTSLPSNFIVLLSPYPENYGAQNYHLQIISTLNALEKVKTKYVIKNKLGGIMFWQLGHDYSKNGLLETINTTLKKKSKNSF